MPGRIRQEDIANVRERSPIADVVGEYLQLKAGGGSLKGLCPFHEERSPSFNVTPGKELYHCFSCGEGGDVITFIRKIEHLDFTEAVERLAARANVELRYEQGGYVPGQEHSQRRRLIEAHTRRPGLLPRPARGGDRGNSPATAFLAERGFSLDDAQKFGVGYSPNAWDELVKHLRPRGFTEDELLKAGLARRTSRGGLIDMFRGRLMWPIRDLTGETVAFGARKLNADEDGPKYLNTPETAIFKKSHLLYGADLAKREIAKRRQAVIVEGYTDVMACHLSGVPTAVATCGTSFGEDHVKILRRLIMDTDGSTGEVIFTFDGDAAGQKAALRAFALEEKFVTQTYVAVQPDGLDPCDLRVKHGDASVRDLVARRVPLFEFAIRSVLSKHDLDTREGQFAAIDEAAPIIVRIKDRAKWKQYAVDLDRWIGFMDERYVLDRVRQAAAAMQPKRGAPVRSNTGGGGTRGRPAARRQPAPGPKRPQFRPVRPGPPGRAGGAQARGAVVGADRAGIRRARPGGVHAARPRGRVRADRRVRRGVNRGPGEGLGGGAARRGAGRRGPRVRDRAGGGAAADVRRAGREVRRRRARPGRRARGRPADRRDQGQAAADEPGGGPGRLRPRVRRAGGA